MKKEKAGILILILCAFMAVASLAEAKNAYVSDVVVTNTRHQLFVYFSVNNCFTSEMNKAIQNGIPTTFNFFVTLSQKKRFWFDSKVANLRFSHTIKYDNLKEIYNVTLSEQNGKTVTVKSYERAQKLMEDVVGVRVASLSSLHRGDDYQLRMMAQLGKIKLPLHLHYVFFFLSLWDFETHWKTVEFKY